MEEVYVFPPSGPVDLPKTKTHELICLVALVRWQQTFSNSLDQLSYLDDHSRRFEAVLAGGRQRQHDQAL